MFIKLLIVILLTIITLSNLLIFQTQYYEIKRFIKVKIHNIQYKYLYMLPFAILDILINNKYFTILSLLFFILLSIEKSKKIVPLKYTFRIIRLISIDTILICLLLIFINKFHLLISYILVILNVLFLIVSNMIDSLYRGLIKVISIRKLKHKLNAIKPIIIGITGSYGKTSTKNYLETILKQKYNVLKTKGNINTFKGVINFLNKNLTNEINLLIIEIGLDKKNGINKFLKLFDFDYAFLTGIEKCHLSTFKTIDNIINEKMKLIEVAKVGFINIDNKYYNFKTYNHYSLTDLSSLYFKNNCMYFKLKYYEKEFKTSIVGDHQILNIIGVIKFLLFINFDKELIYQGVLKLKSEMHRYQLKFIDELLVIDDSYNCNETSFKYAVDSMKYFSQKKIIITPGIIELGKENLEVNYRLGEYMIDKFDEVVLIGNNAMSIKKAFDDKKYKKYIIFKTFKEGFNYLANKKEKNFIILIENDLPDYYLL